MSKGDRDFNLKLIETIEGYDCLYDYKNKDHSNRDKVQLAWENVSKEVGRTAKECKESWRNLRIVYTRALKKPPSGSGAKNKTWYLLENMNFLKPYINITLDKSLPGNLPSPPNNEEFEVFEEENSTELNKSDTRNDFENSTYDDSSYSIRADTNAETTKTTSQYTMVPPKKKKKPQVVTADDCIINYIQSKSTIKRPNEENAKKLFLLSLLPDLEEMSTVQFRAFRRDVGNLIDRTLGQPPIPYLTSNNYQTTFQHHTDSSSYDGHSHTSEQNSSETDHPNMLYQELQPYLLRRPEN